MARTHRAADERVGLDLLEVVAQALSERAHGFDRARVRIRRDQRAGVSQAIAQDAPVLEEGKQFARYLALRLLHGPAQTYERDKDGCELNLGRGDLFLAQLPRC